MLGAGDFSELGVRQIAGKVARDPSALPAPRMVIPEGAVELPADWQDRGIAPELLVKGGISEADLTKSMRQAIRGQNNSYDERSPKVRPIPGMDDYPMPRDVPKPE